MTTNCKKEIDQLVLLLILCLSQCLGDHIEDVEVNTRGIQDIPKDIGNFLKRNKWPQEYFFDNPLIEKLTGHEEPLKHIRIMPYPVKHIQTRFLLYSSWSPNETKYLFDLNYNNQTSLDAFPSKRCSELVLIIHGWSSSAEASNSELLKDSILKNKKDSCVIGVDWRKGADSVSLRAIISDILHSTVYANQAVNTIVVGRQTAFLLFRLVTEGKVKAQNIHIIGHSLGAQIAHFAGSYYTELVERLRSNQLPDDVMSKVEVYEIPSKVGRITGLDPAAPLFDGYPGSYLNKEDASFVDVIHTSIVPGNGELRPVIITDPPLGTRQSVAHVDFYPNGGFAPQPECLKLNELHNVACSHNRAWLYMTESYDRSISRDNFKSVSCESYDMIDKCMKKADESEFGSMGKDAERSSGRGIQFLRYSTSKGLLKSLADQMHKLFSLHEKFFV